MSDEAAPIVVDDARPAVSWVSTLPAGWVTPSERLVLYVLACDAYDDISRPSGEAIASWTGLQRRRVYEILSILSAPNDVRPALIERVDREGRPLGDKRYGGRARTGYRLMANVVRNRFKIAEERDLLRTKDAARKATKDARRQVVKDAHNPATVGENCTDTATNDAGQHVENPPQLSGKTAQKGKDPRATTPVENTPQLSEKLSQQLSGKSAHSLPYPPGERSLPTSPRQSTGQRRRGRNPIADEQTRQLAALRGLIATDVRS